MQDRTKITIILVLACVLAVGGWFWWNATTTSAPVPPSSVSTPDSEERPEGTGAPELAATTGGGSAASHLERANARIAKSQKIGERSDFMDPYGSPEQTVSKDLELAHELLIDYLMQMKTQEFPIGVNEEIMRMLLGDNDRFIPFIPEDHPALNERRELVDRYETPLFFHALSAGQMELRSAGPDREFYTTDDVIYPEPDPSRPDYTAVEP